jgi:3D (Asp-Asp-Asp) domain-containing protein
MFIIRLVIVFTLVCLLIMSWIHINMQADIIKSLEDEIQYSHAKIKTLVYQNTKLEKRIKELESMSIKPVSRGTIRTVTAYTHTGNKTASGTWPEEGRTVAGPRDVPFGTQVYIDGVGWRTVEDRTAKRFDGRYDVFLNDEGDCWDFGKQEILVHEY